MHLSTNDGISDEAAIDPEGCVGEQQPGESHHGAQLAPAKDLQDICGLGYLQYEAQC